MGSLAAQPDAQGCPRKLMGCTPMEAGGGGGGGATLTREVNWPRCQASDGHHASCSQDGSGQPAPLSRAAASALLDPSGGSLAAVASGSSPPTPQNGPLQIGPRWLQSLGRRSGEVQPSSLKHHRTKCPNGKREGTQLQSAPLTPTATCLCSGGGASPTPCHIPLS